VFLVFIRRKGEKNKNTVLQELLPLLHDLIDKLKDVVWEQQQQQQQQSEEKYTNYELQSTRVKTKYTHQVYFGVTLVGCC
jgi:hypothetical protein